MVRIRRSLVLSARRFSMQKGQTAYSPFVWRHIGPQEDDQAEMLSAIGCSSMEQLLEETIPDSIRQKPQDTLKTVPAGATEEEALEEFRQMMGKNKVHRSHIGMGFHNTHTPPVILRNLLENPSWYTPYTPYQAEIAQGRLEMLLNFQTMVAGITGMDICNSSLLDEALAGAEAVNMAFQMQNKKRRTVLLSSNLHPQTIAVIKTRLGGQRADIVVMDEDKFDFSSGDVFAIVLQCPGVNGEVDIEACRKLAKQAQENDALTIAGTDILMCTMTTPPGEWGADITYGHAQRFGVPLGYGGPHAGFIACRDEYKRKMPGRIIGVSKDAQGQPALRMAMQTREQHIRRDKATSNVCTAQALLANVAAAYGVWHGPQGLAAIAERTNGLAKALAGGLQAMGLQVANSGGFFDTVHVKTDAADSIYNAALDRGITLRKVDGGLTITLDETTTAANVDELLSLFGGSASAGGFKGGEIPKRQSEFMTHPIFNSVKSETDMMRYLYKLEKKDLGLNTAMIPLGSCTMKLNSAAEMIPVTWPNVGGIHPFAPREQVDGYYEMMDQLGKWLSDMTGFAGISFQSNSGSQGEYSGLMTIQQYHEAQGDHHRKVCLIPTSAHGTNPASAIFAGLKVVTVKCAKDGGIDVADFKAKAEKYKANLASCMVTYPSTHGTFEETIQEICDICHENGGLVYMDGANLQAQVGFCSPGAIGADVCHLNLHKTFCIPHGGGGPGMGPIGVVEKLLPHLPSHPVVPCGQSGGVASDPYGTCAAAPFGSPSILPISWMYIRMMGREGIQRATATSILSANYMAELLKDKFPVLYRGSKGRCAHEFILDVRELKRQTGCSETDVAKRLMDFGFHAPTMSWPVAGTLMVEPTESESKYELDRFVEAMTKIRDEITDVESGNITTEDSPLRHAPHTVEVACAPSWTRAYTRDQAVFPVKSLRANKYWPTVSRIDDVFGDKNLVCSCPPLSAYEDDDED